MGSNRWVRDSTLAPEGKLASLEARQTQIWWLLTNGGRVGPRVPVGD
jgi:hypothetical protein